MLNASLLKEAQALFITKKEKMWFQTVQSHLLPRMLHNSLVTFHPAYVPKQRTL